MDTGSHLLFGATLAGLAFVDPVVANHSVLAAAVLAGTLVGSHAPDFDAIVRLKGNAAYIRHHRGITHSLPALFIWPALISFLLAWGFGVTEYIAHLYGFTLLAVCFHVFLDLLNAYGVQCFRPFSKKWNHLDILPLFDPFMFTLHGIGLVLWLGMGVSPQQLFLSIYLITALYIILRIIHHHRLVAIVRQELNIDGTCHVIPRLQWFKWLFVMESERYFYTGTINFNKVKVKDVYNKEANNPVIQATMSVDGVRAFLHFAQRIHVTWTEIQDGYEVKWRDMRFWYDHKLPFGIDVKLDRDMKVLSSELGWTKKSYEPPFV